MRSIERRIVIHAPPDDVFSFHDDPANLARITPPGTKVRVLEVRGPAGKGRRVTISVALLPLISREIEVEFVEYDPPKRLSDLQLRGPFARWFQQREFRAVPGGTELRDLVEYELPFGPFGRLLDYLVVQRIVRGMFAFRQERTREIIESGR